MPPWLLNAANHHILMAWLVLAGIVVPPRELRRAIMAMFIGLLLWSGVQKAANGFYFTGDFFSVSYAQPESKFAAALAPFVSESERAELRAFHEAYADHVRRAGPGVLDLPLPRPGLVARASALACAITLATELALPLLLIPVRTRRTAAAQLVLVFFGIEIVAREWTFAALTALLFVPFFRRPPDAPTVPFGRRARVFLGLFLLWPAAQLALVHTMDLNPWKLGGYGMYSVPARLGAVVTEPRRPVSYGAGYALRNVPFANGLARSLAGDPPARVRALTMRYDRAADRFRLEERCYAP